MNVQMLICRVRSGFRPFTLRLTDGRAFSVPHPEFIAIGRAVVVVDRDGFPVNIDPLHIVSLDDRPSRKNGGSHRR
jgi:hypothetical protein